MDAHAQWPQPAEESFHLPVIDDRYAKCGDCSLDARRQAGNLVLAEVGRDSISATGEPQIGYRPGGLMIVGEAPGEHEVVRRRPFVGQAGRLLDSLLQHVGIVRSQCVITNAAKCRPEDNKIDKAPRAVESCHSLLLEEIAVYQPRVIVVMGKTAMRAVLGEQATRKETHKGAICSKCNGRGWAFLGEAPWLSERTKKQRAKILEGGMEAQTKCPGCRGVGKKNARVPVPYLGFSQGVGDVAGAVIAVKRHKDYQHLQSRLPASVEYIIPTYHPSFLMRERAKGAGKGRKDAKGGTFFIPYVCRHLSRAKRLLTEDLRIPVRPLLVDSDHPEAIATITEFLQHREGEIFSVDIETEVMPNAPAVALLHDWAQDEEGGYHCVSCGSRGTDSAADKPCAATYEGVSSASDESDGVDPEEPNARQAAKERLDPLLERITCIGFARSDTDQVLVVDLRDVQEAPWRNPRYYAIGEFLSRAHTKKVFHNGGFDTAVLEARYNEIEKRSALEPVPWRVQGWSHDTMLVAKNIWPDLVLGGKDNPVGLPLKWVAHTYIGAPPWKPPKKGKDGRPAFASFEELAVYNARDCSYTLRSLFPLYEEAREEAIRPEQIALDLKMQKLAVAMQRIGLPIHKAKLEMMREVVREKLEESTAAFQHYAGKEINLRSTKQLEQLLFKEWNLPVGKRTDAGSASTATEVLKDLVGKHPGIDALLDLRRHGSTLKMQLDPWAALSREDPRSRWHFLHATWRACMATSGRWTSTPNAQNAPRFLKGLRLDPSDPRAEFLRIRNGVLPFRQIIAAPPGYVVVGADYSALEQRVVAAICGGDLFKLVNKKDDDSRKFDPTFDCHACVAELVFGTQFTDPAAFLDLAQYPTEKDLQAAIKDRKKLLRDDTKRVVYARNYGSGARTILEIVREENPRAALEMVEHIIAAYDRRFPELVGYRDFMFAYAKEKKELRTLIHQRRRAWPYGSISPTDTANFPIQGTAADIVNTRVLALSQQLRPEAHLFYQGHDAVAALVPEPYAEEVRDQMNELLPARYDFGKGEMLFDAVAKIGESLDQV